MWAPSALCQHKMLSPLDRRASFRRSDPIRRAQFAPGATHAGEVAGKVGHADLHLGASEADGAHEQLHAVLLAGEDVLDSRTHRRAGGIGLRVTKPAMRAITT